MKSALLAILIMLIGVSSVAQMPALKTGHPILLLDNAKLTELQNYYNSRKPIPAAPSSSGTRPLYGTGFPQEQGRVIFGYYPMHYSELVVNSAFFDNHGIGSNGYIRQETD